MIQTAGGRVAFFGGSFDPPHLGHLAVARAARAALGLDTVLFAPVGVQPLKPRGATAAFEDRLAMTRLAVADEPGFAVSLIDAPQPSGAPNFTLETLEKLRAQQPAGGRLFCLMGADSFFGLRHWHRADEIPFVAPLIVASRPGQPLDQLQTALPAGLALEPGAFETGAGQIEPSITLQTFSVANGFGRHAPFYLLPGLDVEISASAIRAQVRGDGETTSAGKLLGEAVAGYVWSHDLYR